MTAEREADRPFAPVNPPAFNVPRIVLVLLALFAFVHVLRFFVLSPEADLNVLIDMSFVAGCYDEAGVACLPRPRLALLWSPLTHAFLHADWTHLGLNGLWMLAFGTPVARRLGARRFLAFAGLGAISGAALFYVVNPDLFQPMIGASGVVSAFMGGACRFALGPVARLTSQGVVYAPRLGILAALSDRTTLFFVAVFFATNFFIGVGSSAFAGAGPQIAWEAHLGGFAFGFLSFGLFDRRESAGRAI